MTLRPDSTLNTTNLMPLREHAQAVRCLLNACPGSARAARFLFIDVAGNVFVFSPIGLALAGALGGSLAHGRLLTVVVLGAALSITIELIQLAIPSRATDVDDVLFNTLGAGLGAAVLIATQQRLNYRGDGKV